MHDTSGTIGARYQGTGRGTAHQQVTMVTIPDKIIVRGNYHESNHETSRIVDPQGSAPTVKENHGTVTAVIETPDNVNADGTCRTIKSNYKDNAYQNYFDDGYYGATCVTIYDDFNGRIRQDQDTIGTITPNFGSLTPTNGTKIIEELKVPSATKKGYEIAKEGDSVSMEYPTSKTRRGRVGGGK